MKGNMSKCKVTTIGMDYFWMTQRCEICCGIDPKWLEIWKKTHLDVNNETKISEKSFLKNIALAILVQNLKSPYNCS